MLNLQRHVAQNIQGRKHLRNLHVRNTETNHGPVNFASWDVLAATGVHSANVATLFIPHTHCSPVRVIKTVSRPRVTAVKLALWTLVLVLTALLLTQFP